MEVQSTWVKMKVILEVNMNVKQILTLYVQNFSEGT